MSTGSTPSDPSEQRDQSNRTAPSDHPSSRGGGPHAAAAALARLAESPARVGLVRDVRPWGGPRVDLRLQDGRVAAVVPHDPAAHAAPTAPHASESDDGLVVEGHGALCVPTLADAHAHLDSVRLGLPFRPHTGRPGVWGMMSNDRENWRHAEALIGERVETALGMMIARGTTHVRTYAQVDVDAGLERLEAVLAARERFADAADVEVVAFPQAGLLLEAGSADVLAAAMDAGADVVGGIDPCQLDRDPVRHLDAVFGLAERHGAPVDVHLHEQGSLGAFSLELIAERVRVLGMQGRVTVAHAFALGTLPDARRDALLATLAELDVALTTIAPAGAGTLPLDRILQAGVRLGLGEDGQRDYWSPYGNADLVDRAWQLAFTQGFRADDDVARCLEVAAVGGRSVRDPAAPRVSADRPASARTIAAGDAADLLLVPAETLASAVMDRPAERTVIHRWRLVAAGEPHAGR